MEVEVASVVSTLVMVLLESALALEQDGHGFLKKRFVKKRFFLEAWWRISARTSTFCHMGRVVRLRLDDVFLANWIVWLRLRESTLRLAAIEQGCPGCMNVYKGARSGGEDLP